MIYSIGLLCANQNETYLKTLINNIPKKIYNTSVKIYRTKS